MVVLRVIPILKSYFDIILQDFRDYLSTILAPKIECKHIWLYVMRVFNIRCVRVLLERDRLKNDQEKKLMSSSNSTTSKALQCKESSLIDPVLLQKKT